MSKKHVCITSDGTIRNTRVYVDGVQLLTVKALRIEADSESDEIQLTLSLHPVDVELEFEGDIPVTERKADSGAVA